MGVGSRLERTRSMWRGARDVFQQAPRLRLLLVSYLVSGILSGLLVTVMPLFFLDRGMSFLQLGSIYSLVAVTSVGVQLLSGRHHQFFGRPAVVLGLMLVTVFTFPAYLWIHTPLQFMLVMATGSFAGAASGPGLQVLVAEAAPRNVRASVYARFGLTRSWSHAAGLVVGGLMLGAGFAPVFYLGSALSLLSFLATGGLVLARRLDRRRAWRLEAPTEEERSLHARSTALHADLSQAGTRMRRTRARLDARLPVPRQAAGNLRWAILYLFLFGVSLSVYPVYFPRYLVLQGLPIHWVGLVSAASWVSFGISQPLGARFADSTGHDRGLIVASLLAAAALNLVMALASSLWWIIGAWVLLGLADGVGRPVTAALIVSSTPAPHRGRAFGWTDATITASGVVAPFGLAFLVMARGIPAGLLAVTATIVLAAVPLLFIREVSGAAPVPSPAVVVAGGDAA